MSIRRGLALNSLTRVGLKSTRISSFVVELRLLVPIALPRSDWMGCKDIFLHITSPC